MLRTGLIALLLFALLAAASCGQSVATAHSTDFALSAGIDVGNSIGAEGAQVTLAPGAPGSYELRASGLSGAKALYAYVSYDPAAMHLRSADDPGAGDLRTGVLDGGRLTLISDQPAEGKVYFGTVLADYTHKPGLSGELSLAQLAFAPGPADVTKVSMLAPVGVGNTITLTGSVDVNNNAVLNWLEALQGDGGNDGFVSIADLTPLGGSFTKAATDSITRDADYNHDGLVTVNDLTPLGAALGTTLGGYKVMAGPVAGTLAEVADISRAVKFPTKLPLGEVTWDWTSPAPLAADTDFQVVPYDNTPAKNLGLASNKVTLLGAPPTQTITDITSITYDDPNAVVIDTGTELHIILTEESVDALPGNAPAFSLENLQLHATADISEDPNPIDATALVIWDVIDGGGLASVSNTAGSEGLLTPHDRGSITIQAQAINDPSITKAITIKLLSIESVDLTLAAGGAGPVAVNAGTQVGFNVNGVFDWDATINGNEETLDLTAISNWATLPDATNTGTYSVNTGTATLDTTGSDSGDKIRVSAEYPRTDNVLLGDNTKRASNFVTVTIN